MTRSNLFAVVLILSGAAVLCPAQSHDPKNPMALGPGVNKGNVDNKQNGPNYYYFYVGPGRVDLHYAFKEMGVFGNPFRQALSFDLFDQNDKLVAHDAIVAVDRMETFTRSDNFLAPRRLLLRVISPNTALRLGGYYEIEATGAVSFGGPATGAAVKPEGTSLYLGGGSLTTGKTVSLYKGNGVLYKPLGALTRVEDSPKELRLTLAADILFDFDRATIRADAQAALDRAAQIIRLNQGSVRIEGFTDSLGRADYNLRLSNARAEAVRQWLVNREGLGAVPFATQGFGASHFAAPNTKPDGSDDPAGRQRNRRVEIIIHKRS